MSHLDEFRQKYDPEKVGIPIHGRRYQIFTPRSLDRFIDPARPLRGFPLWVKIWPAAAVLAEWVAAQPVDGGRRLIEIGAGLGLVSIVAADRGHRITLSEYDADALEFARASARLNRCPKLPVLRLDWKRPWQGPGFDLVLGSELVYRSEDIAPLEALFAGLLNPGGIIVLAGERRTTTAEFLERMRARFSLRLLAEAAGTPGSGRSVHIHELKAAG